VTFRVFSVDDHIIEPADVWSSRVPARFREAAPHVVEEDGREFWVYENQRFPTMGLNAVAGKPRESWNMEPVRFSDMIPGCYDPKARAQDLLSQGVFASVSFPTLPRFGGMLFTSFADKELASQCVRAWNDFVLDEWCPSGPPGLYVPMTICQVWDPALAEQEIRRCADKGSRALCFVENPVPDGLPTFHSEHWDPIWSAAEELGMPVCMHILSSGFVPIVDPSAPETSTLALGNVGAMLAMINLLVSPVCHRFPGIQLVFSEAGVGWIPAILERADRMVTRHHYWDDRVVDLKPSEIFARNMFACMVEEPIGLSLHDLIGADRILAETDYPHADTTYPRVQDSFSEVFEGLPEDVIEAVSHGNAERLFRWSMADAESAETPEITSWRSELELNPFAASELPAVAHIVRS
jgi:predicted TIM-barrel fold metal-dependent hydrolase